MKDKRETTENCPLVFGALAAFELERRHRRREPTSSQCAKGNKLISTLGSMLTVLEYLQATRPQLKGGKPSTDCLRPVPGIPSSMPSITFGDLDFLLETNDPMDRCAQVYGRLAHAQAQFDLAVALFSDWNERARAFQECRSCLCEPGFSGFLGLVVRIHWPEAMVVLLPGAVPQSYMPRVDAGIAAEPQILPFIQALPVRPATYAQPFAFSLS
ncbi:hypothetical protein [Wenzhouxiangella sp. XN24]|uniref:hypothetical protein n=1 Tax=Wenzhouxiangella sp. XN24 TaxID=2713569 RepID=UPI0013EC5831|nr:hypothetical protein [Wenzhouxiangella sp. XN24]NGX16572.1 hypothetical protein [Wenzhouxiangella sp. XN24]